MHLAQWATWERIYTSDCIEHAQLTQGFSASLSPKALTRVCMDTQHQGSHGQASLSDPSATLTMPPLVCKVSSFSALPHKLPSPSSLAYLLLIIYIRNCRITHPVLPPEISAACWIFIISMLQICVYIYTFLVKKKKERKKSWPISPTSTRTKMQFSYH